MPLSIRPCVILGFGAVLFLAGFHPPVAQVCRDLDGDGAEQGFTCLPGTDCEDLSWRRHPGASETCDGLDNDCDADLDLGCDRHCDQNVLFPLAAVLEVENLPQARGGCAGLFEDGILSVSRRLIGADTLYYGRGHDRLGAPLGPSSTVGDPSIATPWERACKMATAGDRAVVSYRDDHERDANLVRLMARVVDRLGRPLTPAPIDLSATSPVTGTPWNDEHAVWDGERFYVFWTPGNERENLLMSRIEADGTPADPATIVVTNDVNGLGEEVENVRAVWTGDHFVVVVSVDPDSFEDEITLHTLKVTRDGQVLARDTIPSREEGGDFAIAKSDDRVAVLWSKRDVLGAGINFFRMAFTDLDAGYLANPGVITLHEGDTQAVPFSGNKYLAWTGEMFGAAYATWEQVGGTGEAYEWRFSRVLPDGTILDPDGALLADDASLDDIWGLQWNGREFWLYGVRGPQFFVRQKIMCDCGDADGDTFGACTGQDCDDTDPLANIAQLESCRGLTDDDCDGLVDCADGGDCPGGPGPGDVTDLAWSGSTLSWSAPSGAERYDLARGLLSDLVRRGDLRQGDCAGLELSVPSWTDDGRDPPSGDVLWYAVRPEGQPCHLGSYGVGGVTRETEVCR